MTPEQNKEFADSLRSLADDFESGKLDLQGLEWDRDVQEVKPNDFNPSEDDLKGIRHFEPGCEVTAKFTFIDREQQAKSANAKIPACEFVPE